MSDPKPDPDDRTVEAESEPGPLPEDERPVAPATAEPGPVPEDERLVPDDEPDAAAGPAS